MVKNTIAAFVVVIVYTAYGTKGTWTEQLYEITKISVDLLEGQATLWVDIGQSMTSCGAKCLFEKDCFLTVYFTNDTCNGYGRLWVLLTKPNENGTHAHAYVMSRMTDSVQCPDGSVYVQTAGTCLVFMALETTWEDALAGCKAINSTLAEIETGDKAGVVAAFSSNSPDVHERFWIGATREEGTWRWATSGRLIEYTNWYPGHPKSIHACAGMYTPLGGKFWFGYECGETAPALCEKRII